MGGNAQRRLCNQPQPVPLRCLASQLDCRCRKYYFLPLPRCRLHLTPAVSVHCAGAEPAARLSGAVPCHTRPHQMFFRHSHSVPPYPLIPPTTRHLPHIYFYFDKSPADAAVYHRPNERQCRCTSTPNTKMFHFSHRAIQRKPISCINSLSGPEVAMLRQMGHSASAPSPPSKGPSIQKKTKVACNPSSCAINDD
ncbi:hypothetical protein TRVL_08498 [Trypanosoma vivax]|nr:hypothetical protein TRVL_08498 [Trypanosoma vivax]